MSERARPLTSRRLSRSCCLFLLLLPVSVFLTGFSPADESARRFCKRQPLALEQKLELADTVVLARIHRQGLSAPDGFLRNEVKVVMPFKGSLSPDESFYLLHETLPPDMPLRSPESIRPPELLLVLGYRMQETNEKTVMAYSCGGTYVFSRDHLYQQNTFILTVEHFTGK